MQLDVLLVCIQKMIGDEDEMWRNLTGSRDGTDWSSASQHRLFQYPNGHGIPHGYWTQRGWEG